MEKGKLEKLAEILAVHNRISKQITAIIDRPAQIGHVGEFIASQVFDIELESSAVHKGSDGRFRSGALAGRTVNIKWYAKREGIVDISLKYIPDFYLVFAGPLTPPSSSRGEERPWLIEGVFLFDAKPFLDALKERGVKIGIPTSVARQYWNQAQVFPKTTSSPLLLTSEQCEILNLFSESRQRA